jgi:phosphatidate phosphatase PAH1
MQLRDGENAVAFRVGRTTLSAHLYVLPADARVCVSDVDGTITKSAGPTMS